MPRQHRTIEQQYPFLDTWATPVAPHIWPQLAPRHIMDRALKARIAEACGWPAEDLNNAQTGNILSKLRAVGAHDLADELRDAIDEFNMQQQQRRDQHGSHNA